GRRGARRGRRRPRGVPVLSLLRQWGASGPPEPGQREGGVEGSLCRPQRAPLEVSPPGPGGRGGKPAAGDQRGGRRGACGGTRPADRETAEEGRDITLSRGWPVLLWPSDTRSKDAKMYEPLLLMVLAAQALSGAPSAQQSKTGPRFKIDGGRVVRRDAAGTI